MNIVNEREIMAAMRQRLADSGLRGQALVATSAQHYRHLDLAFYEAAAGAWNGHGFVTLGDFAIPELAGGFFDLRRFMRIAVSRDGDVAAAFHPRLKFLVPLVIWIL